MLNQILTAIIITGVSASYAQANSIPPKKDPFIEMGSKTYKCVDQLPSVPELAKQLGVKPLSKDPSDGIGMMVFRMCNGDDYLVDDIIKKSAEYIATHNFITNIIPQYIPNPDQNFITPYITLPDNIPHDNMNPTVPDNIPHDNMNPTLENGK